MRAQTDSPSSGEATAVGPVAAPREVRASFALWLAAIAAAVFETILVIIEVASGHSALSTGGMVVGVGVRLLIFGAVVYIALRMLRGRNWARITLAVGLGVFVAGADLMVLLFASSRVVHLISVFAALVLMFRPAANAYFRAARSARRRTRARP